MISAVYTGPLAPSIGLNTLMHCKLNRPPYAASTAQHPKRAKTWTPNVWQPPKISSAAEQNISAKKLIWHMQDTTDRQGSVQCLNGTESDSTASHWSPFCKACKAWSLLQWSAPSCKDASFRAPAGTKEISANKPATRTEHMKVMCSYSCLFHLASSRFMAAITVVFLCNHFCKLMCFIWVGAL